MRLKPRLERHFGLKLHGLQPLQFLIYRRGDFFHFHADVDRSEGAPRYLRRRRVSVVISLSGETRLRDGTAAGGALMFSGLLGDARGDGLGFSLHRKPGLLIAFRSDQAHAVSPVKRGERYSIVSWYD